MLLSIAIISDDILHAYNIAHAKTGQDSKAIQWRRRYLLICICRPAHMAAKSKQTGRRH